MRLHIVIPALDEEEGIRSIIERTLAARDTIVAGSPIEGVEVTVVSDGSTDRTVDRAREYEDRLRLIEFPENRGYGAAIMAAWAEGDAEVLGFLDADGTCDPAFFAPLCRRLLEDEADVALGCRMTPDSRMPLLRRAGNRLFAWMLSAFASHPVRDVASGMRVVRREALDLLYPLPTGLHFTPAMSARAMLSRAIRIVELDMPYAERRGRSKLRVLRDGARFVRVIVETALLYRPGWLLVCASVPVVLATLVLMAQPIAHYIRTTTVAEWMIYRFLVAALLGHVALLLWGAALLSTKVVRITLSEEAADRATDPSRWFRRWCWPVIALLGALALLLVWETIGELWQTGHTQTHWSRFVVAIACCGAAATIGIVRLLDGLLALVEARVRYLAARP